ncbi:unnamed protein product [Nesidiocoris tenuis]|uniref:Uncharacterized protein n=1 Tax=Nesidiocoris tenuis TaxID=355587 RepID=A0A6H5GDM4_9HEMI|nr:unnamed protein product [Nesidiocoris tenuis]
MPANLRYETEICQLSAKYSSGGSRVLGPVLPQRISRGQGLKTVTNCFTMKNSSMPRRFHTQGVHIENSNAVAEQEKKNEKKFFFKRVVRK